MSPFNEQRPQLSDAEIQVEYLRLKQAAKPYLIASIVGFAAFILTILMTFINASRSFFARPNFLLIFIFFISSIISVVLFSKKSQKMKQFLSEHVTTGVLAETFDIESYDPKAHFDEATIRRCELTNSWNEISGSDLVTGYYRGHYIRFCDLKLEERTSSTDADGNTTEHVTTVFHGPWIFIDHPRQLAGTLRLRERKGFFSGKGNLETENIAFNKKFRITANDGHTAFLILTPHFMEYITRLDESYGGTTNIGFYNNHICVAISNDKDMFETSWRKDADIESIREKQRGEIRYLCGIIDEIMLNDYLYSR